MFRAAAERMRRERNERMSLAWHTAALMRIDPKKFPKLSRLMHPGTRRAPAQTPEQLLQVVRTMNSMFGGRVKDRDGR